MPKPSVDELMAADSGLNRSLAACVAVFLSGIGLLFMVSRSDKDVPWAQTAGFVLMGLLLACYVWYAICCGRAAKVLGEPGWRYAAWIVAAPLISPLPGLVATVLDLPAPGLISTAIAISPLSIKFLLGRQLDEAIRQKAFED